MHICFVQIYLSKCLPKNLKNLAILSLHQAQCWPPSYRHDIIITMLILDIDDFVCMNRLLIAYHHRLSTSQVTISYSSDYDHQWICNRCGFVSYSHGSYLMGRLHGKSTSDICIDHSRINALTTWRHIYFNAMADTRESSLYRPIGRENIKWRARKIINSQRYFQSLPLASTMSANGTGRCYDICGHHDDEFKVQHIYGSSRQKCYAILIQYH